MPRVTVCVSVLNDPDLLRDCLKHIHNQSYTDWECIVVDDGSEVSHEPVVKEFNDERFIFHRFEQNRGIPFGANYAFKIARGDYICSLGVDELIWEKKLEVQIDYLDHHSEDIIWGVPGNGPMGPVPLWEQYKLKAHNRSKYHWLKLFLQLEGIPIGGASAMWRKSLFDSVGYMDEKLTMFSDHEYFCRIFEKHKVRVLPYRFMNEIPGRGLISGLSSRDKPHNRIISEKADKEYPYVLSKHAPMLVPAADGLITIAMPVYNHARFIADMLRCVFAQTDQNFELLIMNDGSTDDLEAVLQDFKDPRISYFKSDKNEGMMACANKMLDMAKGEFFILLSADDKMEPNFLEKCRQEFAKDPFLEHVSTQNDFIAEDGTEFKGEHPFQNIQRAVNHTQDEWHELFYHGNVYFGIGMYRTSALRDVGGWEPENGVISDYQMYLKLIPRYNFKIIEEPLTHTRIHGKNQSLLNAEEGKKLKRRYYDAQRPFYQPRPRVVIATPFYELKAFSPYVASLTDTTNLLTRMGIQWAFMELSGDSYVHRARNSMCSGFLDDPYNTDLFFIDSDMSWNPEAFIGMIFRPEPIIGGTYPVKNKWELWTSKPAIEGTKEDSYYVGHPLPDGSALIKAHQLAGGFLRIKRSVLEKYKEFYPMHRYNDTNPVPEMRIPQTEFFATGIDREPEINLLKDIEEAMKKSNGSGLDMTPFKERFEALKGIRDFVGEDYCFSNRLRQMGVELFIYPNATITHYGIAGHMGNFNDLLKQSAGKPPSDVVYP